MNIVRTAIAGAATVTLAFGALVAGSTVSSATIWESIGPFGVINQANRAKCESVRRVYTDNGYMTKPCAARNGQYYFLKSM